MKKLYILIVALMVTGLSYGQIFINEIDADQTGTDTEEFIELKGTPGASLDGYVVVLFNGSDDLSYNDAFDLDGKTLDANGFFILANTALVTGTDIDMGADNALQNGADAVTIFQADGTDFPNDTPIPATLTNLIDVLVYGTSDDDDPELLTGFGETVQYDENENGAKDTESIQRKSDGTYETKAPTFRQENDTAVCDLTLASNYAICDAFTTGTDTYTANVNFSGGGTETYVVSADSGVVGGDDPSSVVSGTITVTGLSEGTDVIVSVVGGLCDLSSTVISPVCEPGLDLPLYEGFDYTDGANLGDQPNWTNNNSGDEVLVATGSLSYTGLDTSGGNSVTFDSGGMDPIFEITPINAGTVFASFIIKVTDQSAITDTTDGGYFAGISDSNTTYDARVWLMPNPDAASLTYDIGISNPSSPTFTPTTYNIDDEVFIVMSYEVGTGITNLWVNPASTDLGGTAPAVTLTVTDPDPAASISRFLLRQDSTGETPFITFDELRMGTTWEQVTPVEDIGVTQNEINGFSLYPNPVKNGFVTISTDNNLTKDIQIFDVLGKQVLATTITSTSLNIANLKAGVYIIKVVEAGHFATRKLVIE